MPEEFPRRPNYVPWHGYVALVIPAGFAAFGVYYDEHKEVMDVEMRIECHNSLEEVVDLPVE